MPKVPPDRTYVPDMEHIGDARQADTTVEPDDGGSNDPLDWDHALEAAAARLIEASIEPDTIAHMEESGQANEFAATLCAYGLLVEEVEHMHRREDDAKATQPATPGRPKVAP
jgi:hypothetical protein